MLISNQDEGRKTPEKNQKGNKMEYYKITANFQIVRYAETLADAERIYNEMIRDGMNYVELSFVKDFKSYESYSLKIHY